MKDRFLQAMSFVANSVHVVTTDGPAARAGVTVSATCSVSLEDDVPTLLVCVHEASRTAGAVQKNGVFAVNLLGEEQEHISDSFAGRTQATGLDRFDCAEWLTKTTGAPILADALASFECKLLKEMHVGTHHIFVGEVQNVEIGDVRLPLVYHDRHYGLPQSTV